MTKRPGIYPVAGRPLTSVSTILRQRLATARLLRKLPASVPLLHPVAFPPPRLLPPFQRLSLLVSAKCDEAGKQAETWECSVEGWRGGAVATGGKCPN